MSENVLECVPCGANNVTSYRDVFELDSDNISYWEKLIICISPDLVKQQDNSVICCQCIDLLRISYEFKTTALKVQEALLLRKTEHVFIIEEEEFPSEFVKEENDSDDNKNDSYCPSSEDDDEGEKGKSRKCGVTRSNKSSADLSLPCEHCGALFNKAWKLKKHVNRVHNAARNHVCTYCLKEFKQSFHLKEHLTSHTGEMNFSCHLCDKKFMRLSSQRRHLAGHERPPGQKTKKTPFLCTICGKSFPFSNGVQRHMRIHTGVKKFECQWCARKFTQSTHLQVHLRTHTGEKPYICDSCGEKFSLKACLLKHIENKHCKDSKSRSTYS